MKQLIVIAAPAFALAALDGSTLLAARMLDPVSGRVMVNTIHVDRIESASENSSAKAAVTLPICGRCCSSGTNASTVW
jgi:hypothetical protein